MDFTDKYPELRDSESEEDDEEEIDPGCHEDEIRVSEPVNLAYNEKPLSPAPISPAPILETSSSGQLSTCILKTEKVAPPLQSVSTNHVPKLVTYVADNTQNCAGNLES